MTMDTQRFERYMRDPLPIRLGNLSSSLGRLADSVARPERSDMALRMVSECRWFIEWTGPEADPDTAARLAQLQLDLTRWHRELVQASDSSEYRVEVARLARESADRVLDWSGLLAD